MDKNSEKRIKRIRRHARVRAKITGTALRPRMCVYRSNIGMYVQLIDDTIQKTMVSASTKELKMKKGTKQEAAAELGKLIAKKASSKKIKSVVFDKGGFKYHGRVKAVAEAARENGLKI
ncbi:50S ribosomal protein L18 [Candidatus Parcubacteria bacterium]|nr:50S ribosomal protein L18 [Candidatus Parcubacteria bacterium]